MRVFLDANVLFSASNAGSALARMITAAGAQVTLLTSDLACAEALRNLELKRPAWIPALDALLRVLEIVPTTLIALEVDLADKDVPLLSAAISARSDHFVTGDRKDFGHLFETTIQGVTVITPLRFAEILTTAPKEPRS